MVRYGSVVILLCSVALLCYAVSAMADNPLPSGCATKAAVEIQNPLTPNVPPKGFIALFNGNDLAGWRGLGHVNPLEIAKWNDQERIAKQKEADADMARHWRVEEGQIINDGHGVYLTTVKDYGDFELILDWCMMVPNADSGIYLRGSPQVQIWDPHGKTETATGIEKGSGALWNNEKPEGKFPPVVADKSIGEWNTFRILMIGQRVTVDFNGKRTVDNAIMENYWDRGRPIFPRGPIQLQTHGGEMRFRNVFIREIIPEEADKALQARDDKGFESIFNGKDLSGWTRETEGYMVKDGALVTKKDGGTILTREQYDDFAIRFEFKLPPDGNNGLAVRAPPRGQSRVCRHGDPDP